MRYYGHPQVAVLDGGLSAWPAAGQDVSAEVPAGTPGTEIFDDRGYLRPPDELRAVLNTPSGAAVGAYCGSGVTAAQLVLALEVAGHRAAGQRCSTRSAVRSSEKAGPAPPGD